MKKATKEELLKLGFKEDEHEEEKCLSLKLNKGKDRFYHFLRWYEDEPDKFYIDEVLISKVKTISEEDFLVNTNNLTTNAIEHYKQIMEKLQKNWRKGQVILPEFRIINNFTGEEYEPQEIKIIDYTDQIIKYSKFDEEGEMGLEDASFIYTKATSDLQEDISNWVTNNKEEIEESILKATNKELNQYAESGITFDITDEVDKDELVTQITEDIIQGILNVISTYEQEV